MFTLDDVKEKSPLFLVELYLQTQGDPSVTVSWFDIGETMGLDREASTKTAENLFGTGLAEIKTLSGGIGITADGVAEAQQLGASITGEHDPGLVLGNTPVLNESACQAVERIVAGLKGQIGEKRLDFDSLAELMADLKSIKVKEFLTPDLWEITETFCSKYGKKMPDTLSRKHMSVNSE